MREFLIIAMAMGGLAALGLVSFLSCLVLAALTGKTSSDLASHSIVAVILGSIGFVTCVILAGFASIGVIP